VNFLHFNLGQRPAGAIVRTSLRGSESDVFLVDSMNFSRFKRGESFEYTGGHFKQSPVTLQVPHASIWTAVVIPSGRVEASVEVLG